MSILNKLATSLNRRDEIPNQQLAKEIAVKNNRNAVKELIENLGNKSRDIQHDCIKVLYEIGEIKPLLIKDYIEAFMKLLTSKNNRMQWGAMHALDTITEVNPDAIFSSLPNIIEAADKGSVITRDHAVNILIKLCGINRFEENAFVLLTEQLLASPVNQLPMYAERAMPVIREKNRLALSKSLMRRIEDFETGAKRNRIEKVIKKLNR